MVIGIIGAGASGMAAAISAAHHPGVQVELFERQARVGRKLQATGNGRCNLSNIHADASRYHGEDPSFVLPALSRMGAAETLVWFRELGLFTVTEESGKVYPYSDQANSVVDVLRFALQAPNITLRTGFEVKKVTKSEDGFVVDDGEQTVFCDKLIIACGGIAGTKLGGSMSGYRILSRFGHRSTRLRPALVQLKTDWNGVVALKGVRAQCQASVYQGDMLFAKSEGEVQFTEYGLSGPVIFEVSRDVCVGSGRWSCRLDFLPDYTKEQVFADLCKRRRTCLTAEDLLTGILHNRLGRVIVKTAHVQANCPVADITDEQLYQICDAIKCFEITISEAMGMDSAQVTAGGVHTCDFDPETMESKLVSGLYACGEVLDIDGDCGGFNLQWAWSSGCCAGEHAGKGTV